MTKCPARLSLILPDEMDPSVIVDCEKAEHHQSFHEGRDDTGALYGWESHRSDRPARPTT